MKPNPEYQIEIKQRQSYAAIQNQQTLAESLFISHSNGLWAMLTAYFDESGTQGSSPILVVAGLVSESKQWLKFSNEWARALERANAPYFHMKEFAHGVGAFKGWKQEQKDNLILHLINIIMRRVKWRVWTAVVMEDYRNYFRGDTTEEYPFSFGAFGCASRLRHLATQISNNYLIPYAFEHGGKGSHNAFDSFNNLLKKGDGNFYRMMSLTVSNSTELLPLQAADLHAYEVYKYFSDQLNATGRPIRKSFERLLSIPEAGGGGYLFTFEKQRMFVDGASAGLSRIDIPTDKLNQAERIQLILNNPLKRNR
jgi:hypothetical protein